MVDPRFFETAAAFRDWLAHNATTHAALTVGFHKVGSGTPSMSWPESVDQALCFGWIDGVRTRIDDNAYQIRFTPRRAGSIWSAVNITKVEALRAAGLMTAAGEHAYAGRSANKSAVYSYEQDDVASLCDTEIGQFKAEPTAWQYFENAPPGYRKTLLHWVASAKKPDTRATRLSTLIAACADGKRLRECRESPLPARIREELPCDQSSLRHSYCRGSSTPHQRFR